MLLRFEIDSWVACRTRIEEDRAFVRLICGRNCCWNLNECYHGRFAFRVSIVERDLRVLVREIGVTGLESYGQFSTETRRDRADVARRPGQVVDGTRFNLQRQISPQNDTRR